MLHEVLKVEAAVGVALVLINLLMSVGDLGFCMFMCGLATVLAYVLLCSVLLIISCTKSPAKSLHV